MSEAMAPLRHFPPFIEWMIRFETPIVGILVGAMFTALIQSSSATTGIVIALASQGLIALPAGIALILGANDPRPHFQWYEFFGERALRQAQDR